MISAPMIRALALACLLITSPAHARSGWWTHVEILAADSMEGRETATEGYLRAARYVARELERIGLEPGGTQGYLQPVRFVRKDIDESRSGVWLVRDGTAVPLDFGREVIVSRLSDPRETLEAPTVFVGNGVSLPEGGHDDLADLDLRGKIAVLIRGAPSSLTGPSRAYAQERGEQWGRLRKAGALGVVFLSRAGSAEVGWTRIAANRFGPAVTLAESTLDVYAGMRVRMLVNAEHAERWFEGSGHALADIVAAADRGEALPRFPLAWRLRVETAASREDAVSPNVVGILPGRDPHLQREYVVLTAHLDHLGIGAAVDHDSVYNGALDNAAGVASLLEIAREIQASRARPRRSLLFLFVTGEEQGLLGSRYFVHHPTVPLEAVVANVNLDMYLPIVPFRTVVAYGLGESDLGDWLLEIGRKKRVRVAEDPEPDRGYLIRSDQWSFIQKGIPALFLDIGADRGSGGSRRMGEWMRSRYHAPSDDSSQPLDRKSAERFTRFVAALVRAAADRLGRPHYRFGSFFHRFEAPSEAMHGMPARGASGGTARP